ncbi:MAG: peptidase M24 [Chloroflexi bacterium OLB13]|nr:MAG: peptidase M24 [Chloroflexi bacterium OLB13]
MDYAARRAKLAQSVQNADAIALVPGANLKYFTGLNLHTSERPIIALVQGEQLSLIIPALEVPQVHARPDLEAQLFAWTDTEGYQGAFEVAVRTLGLADATIAVDDQSMRLFEWMGFEAVSSTIRRHPVGADLLLLRQQKDAGELAAMREACKRSESAFDALLAWVKPGMTERQIGLKLDSLLIEHGCHGLSFESLVQTGPNSARPHGGVTDRALQTGEFLLVDWGGRYNGYPADLTRTVVFRHAERRDAEDPRHSRRRQSRRRRGVQAGRALRGCRQGRARRDRGGGVRRVLHPPHGTRSGAGSP